MKIQKTIWTCIIIVAAIILGLYYFYLFPLLPVIPKIGRNLSPTFKIADQEFSNRVQQAFPEGTLDQDIRPTLTAQGFELRLMRDGKWYADFSKKSFPCKNLWTISWRSDSSGKIKDLQGAFGATCL